MVTVASAGAVREKKQSMAELKLKRLNDLTVRLKEDYNRPRVKVSEACQSIIHYTKNTKDFMIPSVWGSFDKSDDPYNPPSESSCCVVM
ncbi:GGL domain-containing protein [Dipodascopsis tothii]|uniref:GGL domain-containing protein n=1 Tax=Dipodascopsis tothii TaxID=44089 RepID=UPI0034CE1859